MAVRLDKRRDWAQMAQAAEKHFAKKSALNAVKPERMASHPCSEVVRNSGRHFSDLSRRDYVMACNARAKCQA